MLEMPQTDVASVAQKATDGSCCVAVVDMEVTPASRIGRLAYGTQPCLPLQQGIVCSERSAVDRSKFVVSSQTRVGVSPFFGILSHAWQVFSPPLVMALDSTSFAVDRVTVFSVIGLEELRDRFGFFTARAFFDACRGIKSFVWHGWLPSVKNTIAAFV